jgi:L-lactate dehydrogenase complex protein LldG
MNPVRDAILRDIAAGLKRPVLDDAARAAVEARLSAHRRNTVPARGQLPDAERLALFIEKAEAMGCSVARIAVAADIPAAVADYLARHNLPTEIVLSPDPALTGLPWQDRPLLTVKNGVPWESDMVGLARAVAGVAETGTLVLRSGSDASTGLNFTPDTHLVVLRAGAVVAAYEDAFDRLRAERGANWPRTVNLVTGPSRTADIEQTLIMGADGPRRLHILLLNDDAGEAPPA